MRKRWSVNIGSVRFAPDRGENRGTVTDGPIGQPLMSLGCSPSLRVVRAWHSCVVPRQLEEFAFSQSMENLRTPLIAANGGVPMNCSS